MPKPAKLRRVLEVLNSQGFFLVSQKGSHAKYRRSDKNITVIIPLHGKEIPYGTFKSIMRQANLSEKDFE